MVTPRYLPHMGGVESHVHEVARRLARRGVELTVLTTEPGGRLPAREESEGVTIRRVPAWPSNKDYYVAPGLYRAIVQGGWDIVHVQSYHTLVAPLAMWAALRARVPYVVTFHGGGHSSRLRNALRGVQLALLRPLLARATRLIAIASFEIEYYSRRLHVPRNRFVLIPNGSDLPRRVNTDPQGASAGNLIASVGRLERYKGHHRIIAALPYILGEIPDARLWIAGTGPYESALRGLAGRLGVADRVEIRSIPPMEREKMADELSKVALVVLLSEFETHPIAVLEALALGRPALVADTSGLGELARQGYAQAIPLNSAPQEVAAAVLTQLRQPQVSQSLNLPSWDDTTTQLLTLYNNVGGR
jgi:glycosyltransferase involved in cell wall biosynthesis